MSKVAPVSAGIRLTYKANGVGPDLYVVKPYGQAPCRLYYPSTIQFPMVFVITETWRNAGNSGQYNHTIPNPINYAEWMGMASRMVFKSCNGQFASATATKYVPPTATESQAFNRVVEASNGLITYTFRATRTGSTVDEDTTFVFQYRIATGDYTFTTAGGQRVLVNGNTSTVAGNRSGKVVVSVGGAIP